MHYNSICSICVSYHNTVAGDAYGNGNQIVPAVGSELVADSVRHRSAAGDFLCVDIRHHSSVFITQLF